MLQGVYANLSQDPKQYAIHGFVPSGDIAPAKRGLSLAESELGFSASVDDKIYGNLIFSLTPENTVSVEEAYGVLTAMLGHRNVAVYDNSMQEWANDPSLPMEKD